GPGADGLPAVVGKHLRAGSALERAAAAEALGRLPHTDVAALVGAAGEPDGFVREAAVRALGRNPSAAVKSLVDATRDDIPEVRLAAVRALRSVTDASAKSRLAEMAEGDPDPTVRSQARSQKPHGDHDDPRLP